VSFIPSILRRNLRWIVLVLAILVGLVLVLLARGQDGWSQSALIELGAAILLLGPLVFLEELLRGDVKGLSKQLMESERSYAAVRGQLPLSPVRTLTLDGILRDVTVDASQGKVSKEHVTDWVRRDKRPHALAAMLGDHRLIDPDVIVESIGHSGSGIEQYWALLVAKEGWPLLPPVTKQQVVQAIKRDRHGYIAQGPNRSLVAKRILDMARDEGML
jgi:hypothetical protein